MGQNSYSKAQSRTHSPGERPLVVDTAVSLRGRPMPVKRGKRIASFGVAFQTVLATVDRRHT